MKKTLSTLFLVAFVTVVFAGQSWAFGSRGHHGGNGGSSFTGNSGNGPDQSGNNTPNQNFGPGGHDPDPGAGNPPNKNFPVAPVPEPMTLSLLGTGLAGIFLKRKMG